MLAHSTDGGGKVSNEMEREIGGKVAVSSSSSPACGFSGPGRCEGKRLDGGGDAHGRAAGRGCIRGATAGSRFRRLPTHAFGTVHRTACGMQATDTSEARRSKPKGDSWRDTGGGMRKRGSLCCMFRQLMERWTPL